MPLQCFPLVNDWCCHLSNSSSKQYSPIFSHGGQLMAWCGPKYMLLEFLQSLSQVKVAVQMDKYASTKWVYIVGSFHKFPWSAISVDTWWSRVKTLRLLVISSGSTVLSLGNFDPYCLVYTHNNPVFTVGVISCLTWIENNCQICQCAVPTLEVENIKHGCPCPHQAGIAISEGVCRGNAIWINQSF